HLDAADGTALKAGRGPEGERLGLRVEQVERADLGAHPLRDHLDDAVQGLLEVLGLADQRADVLEEAQAVARSDAACRRVLALRRRARRARPSRPGAGRRHAGQRSTRRSVLVQSRPGPAKTLPAAARAGETALRAAPGRVAPCRGMR